MNEVKLGRIFTRVLRSKREHAEAHDGGDGFVVLTDEEQMAAALTRKHGFGGAFDGIGHAEPALGIGGGFDGWIFQGCGEQGVVAHVGGHVAFKDDGTLVAEAAFLGDLGDFKEVGIALFVGEPDDLEGAVAFHGTGGVIVDAFAGT